MKKFYKITLLLTLLIFLTTYNPGKNNFFSNKKDFFFRLKNIEVVNNNIINENEIYEKLTHIYGKNILYINKKELENPLKTIDFIDKVEVKKKYPNTIIIKVYETRPLAVLHKKNNKFLLDTSSNLIVLNENIITDNLPNIFGEGAKDNFINFFNLLEQYNFPGHQVKNYYFFKIGRWDVELRNNRILKFPANKTQNAIQQSVELLNREDFDNYDIIDLRVHGKIIVE